MPDPAAIDQIRQAEADIAEGRAVTGERMAKLMEERRRRERPGA